MMSNAEFLDRLIEVGSDDSGRAAVVGDYINHLFYDIGSRYAVNELTRPFIYAVFRDFSDILLDDADEEAKAACAEAYEVLKQSESKVMKAPSFDFYKGGGKV